ncbi:MAG: metal ABC transporter permease [Sulfuricurvum sp.]
MIDILATPLALIAILVALHAYFGLEILRRGIIFTDLAIAQAAALGVAISLGYFHSHYLYALTLGFALSTALLIAYMSGKTRHLEAFIGILYVLSASAIMLVLSHSAEGMEHFKALLANDILFVLPSELATSATIYAGVAVALLALLPRLSGLLREVAFFSLLAITVTSSVSLAGVFVVFALLIAPPLSAITFGAKRALLFSLVFGWSLSVVATVLSYHFDLPTGYAIVFMLSLASAIIVILKRSR